MLSRIEIAPRYGSRICRSRITGSYSLCLGSLKAPSTRPQVSNIKAQSLRAFSLRRDSALQVVANSYAHVGEIQALTHRLSTWSRLRANEYLRYEPYSRASGGKEPELPPKEMEL